MLQFWINLKAKKKINNKSEILKIITYMTYRRGRFEKSGSGPSKFDPVICLYIRDK